MIRLLTSCFCAILAISCASQGGGSSEVQQITLEPGSYSASVNVDKMDAEVRAYTMTSQITFGFEADHTFIYEVFAMGKENNDVGKWEIRGDSLYIHSLQRGPDSAFKLIAREDGNYEIIGPNHFLLTKKEEITPLKK